MTERDPVAPVRKRPRRVAKKLAQRWGMLRCRGFSVERCSRMPFMQADNLARVFSDRLTPAWQVPA